MKKILTPIFLLFSTFLFSNTTLTQGDIAFIGTNSDGSDDYAFILLKTIDASTTINFTDCGWVDGTASFICNSGDVNGWTWTSGSILNLGQTVTITTNGPGLSTSVGSVSGATPVFSSIGDQIFAYQGSAASPTFLGGFHIDGAAGTTNENWSGGVSNNQTSALPDDLENGTNAIWLNIGGAESDNWQYDCSVTTGSIATVRSAINNITNWVNNNVTPYPVIDPGCAWSITPPLPIELVSFDIIENEKQQVKINWRTATETNNDFFTIEKSKDARNWEVVGKINGSGTSSSELNYEFQDENPFIGLSYYRLKQTDFDGEFEYSSIKSITLENTFSSIKVYPNPTNGLITIEGGSSDLEEFSIINSLGQIVTDKVAIGEISEGKIQLNLSKLPNGFFLVTTKNESYKIYKY